MKTKYKVDGMTCGGCASSLVRAMKAADPSAKAEVHLTEGILEVEEPVDEKVVAQAVAAAGFELRGRA